MARRLHVRDLEVLPAEGLDRPDRAQPFLDHRDDLRSGLTRTSRVTSLTAFLKRNTNSSRKGMTADRDAA